MRKIILDTNFLMIPAMFKVDIFSEIERISNFNYEICIHAKTIEELENIIRNQKGKHKKAARLTLEIAKAKKLKLLESGDEHLDDILLRSEKNNVVATQDAALRKKLMEKGISVMALRQKKYLQIFERNLY